MNLWTYVLIPELGDKPMEHVKRTVKLKGYNPHTEMCEVEVEGQRVFLRRYFIHTSEGHNGMVPNLTHEEAVALHNNQVRDSSKDD
jgi:hypothetical protein